MSPSLAFFWLFNGIYIFASRSLGAEQLQILQKVWAGCRTEDLSLHSAAILLRAPPPFSIDRVPKVLGQPSGTDTQRNGRTFEKIFELPEKALRLKCVSFNK